MYSDKDITEINAKLRKNWLVLGPILAALLAAYVFALAKRVEWLAMVVGPLLFVAACYGILAYLWPNYRYRGFLTDMANGLSRDVKGTVLEISATPELQDGARVLPVRVKLDPDAEQAANRGSAAAARLSVESDEDTQDERIVYLNVSKREGFPGPGAAVVLHCFGRHIKAVEALSESGE